MKKKRKYKINPQKLSRLITSRECKSAQDYLTELYDRLSPESRQAIKEMLERNKLCTYNSLTNNYKRI